MSVKDQIKDYRGKDSTLSQKEKRKLSCRRFTKREDFSVWDREGEGSGKKGKREE